MLGLTLCLDTSAAEASVAVFRDGQMLSLARADSAMRHAESVLPTLERALRDAQCLLSDIEAFAVDVGPGSFTGVRIGVSTVNALALAAGKPVIEVDAFSAIYAKTAQRGTLCILLDARNENVYASVFRDGKRVGGPEAACLQDYIVTLDADTEFCGDGAHAYADKIGGNHVTENSRLYTPSAEGVGLALAFGKTAAQATPLYLRPSQAERLFMQRQGS